MNPANTQNSAKTANETLDKYSTANTIKDVTMTKPSTDQKFYDFYLDEHQNMACRRLHFAGSSFGLLGLAKSLKTGSVKPLAKGIAAGYACAWVGHFFFEKNKPASFKSPLKSFASDFRMYSDVLRGNLSLKDRRYDRRTKKPAP